MSTTAVIARLVGLTAVATVLGVGWRSLQGRVRRTDGSTIVRAVDVPGLRRLPQGATLLQFSTEVCASCTPTRAVLGELASARPGVQHVDLDVTRRPDLATRFRVLQTPTTLILDRKGVVRARIGGAPRRADVAGELDRILEAS